MNALRSFIAPDTSPDQRWVRPCQGDATYLLNITNNIDATGKEIDEEKLAELAATRNMQARQLLIDQERQAHGVVSA